MMVSEALGIAGSVLANVRFCVLPSFSDPTIVQRSIASGADGFVVKDVRSSEFDVALRVLASGSSCVDRESWVRGSTAIRVIRQMERLAR